EEVSRIRTAPWVTRRRTRRRPIHQIDHVLKIIARALIYLAQEKLTECRRRLHLLYPSQNPHGTGEGERKNEYAPINFPHPSPPFHTLFLHSLVSASDPATTAL